MAEKSDDTAQELKCAGCGGAMQEGFIMERAHYQPNKYGVTYEAQDRFWMGLKMDEKQQSKVETYRCERCGRLESYARQSAE